MTGEPPDTWRDTVRDGAQVAAAARADDAFGVDLLGALAGPADAGLPDVVYSPASIAAALRMLLLGARGETARQIAAALHLPGRDDAAHGPRLPSGESAGLSGELAGLSGELAGLADELAGLGGEGLTFRAPNTIWLRSGLRLRPEYARALAGHARAAAHEADFSRAPDKARRAINALVEEQTAGKIVDLLKPGTIGTATVLVLVNAVYLKAAWARPFAAGATRDAPFHTGDGPDLTVPMMRLTARVGYLAGDGYQAVLLPYEDERLAMAVILPDGPLPPCERRLAERGVAGLLAGISPREVELRLPRFRVESQMGLIPALMRLGITDVFDESAADLSGIADADLVVTAVCHAAYLDVDEKGTEAAAATAVVARMLSAFGGGPPVKVTVDRPFLFAIIDTQTSLPLFLGRVVRPR